MKSASGTGDREEAGHSDGKEAWETALGRLTCTRVWAHVLRVGKLLKMVQKWR